MKIEVTFDNADGVTIQTADFCHTYTGDGTSAANLVISLIDGDPIEETDQPESRNDSDSVPDEFTYAVLDSKDPEFGDLLDLAAECTQYGRKERDFAERVFDVIYDPTPCGSPSDCAELWIQEMRIDAHGDATEDWTASAVDAYASAAQLSRIDRERLDRLAIRAGGAQAIADTLNARRHASIVGLQ